MIETYTHRDLTGLGEATVVLYLAVQRVIVIARAGRLALAPAVGPGWSA